jgi:hypothetical protein
MTLRIGSLAQCSPELRDRIERSASGPRRETPPFAPWDLTRRNSKFNAKKVRVDGFVFDSTLEARRYGELKLLMQAGDVRWFALQAVFLLTGGVVYKADFVIHWKDGTTTVEDAKGLDRQVSRNKRKQVRALYNGLEVLLWPPR